MTKADIANDVPRHHTTCPSHRRYLVALPTQLVSGLLIKKQSYDLEINDTLDGTNVCTVLPANVTLSKTKAKQYIASQYRYWNDWRLSLNNFSIFFILPLCLLVGPIWCNRAFRKPKGVIPPSRMVP